MTQMGADRNEHIRHHSLFFMAYFGKTRDLKGTLDFETAAAGDSNVAGD